MIGACAVDGCDRTGKITRGYCNLHYLRLRQHGDVHYNHYERTPGDRFWPKVDKSGSCWIWLAHKDPRGYGKFRLGGRAVLAHRASYEWANGPIPDGMMLDHRCRLTSCVNPGHLRLVTSKQNQEHRTIERKSGGMRGANFVKKRGLWEARAKHNRQTYIVGHYETQEEAAEAARQLRLSLYTHNDQDRKTA